MQNEELEFHAAINGVVLSKEEEPSEKKQFEADLKSAVPLFGDPEEYKNLSSDEKQSMTESMKKKHQVWSSDKKA